MAATSYHVIILIVSESYEHPIAIDSHAQSGFTHKNPPTGVLGGDAGALIRQLKTSPNS
jgi:hypothetical protein